VIVLPDVNVLIAVAWPEHTFHAIAVEWFDAHADDGWATCAITETGFMRISANANVVQTPVRPSDSAALLLELRAVGSHRFWNDLEEPATSPLFARERLIGHRQVTDAHLLCIARQHQGSLATFDRGVQVLARGLLKAHVTFVGGGG
jgi:uncharacterized protein